MVNWPKHFSKQNDSTFTIFIDPWEGNSSWKSLSEWYEKYQDCLLTHWLLITSILFLLETVYSKIFRCNYLRKEKHFVNFFGILEISIQCSTFSKKRWPSFRTYFWTYGLRKTWLHQSLKSPVSEVPLTSNMVNAPKHRSNMNKSIFTGFIDPHEHNSCWKSSSEWYTKS